MKAGGEVRPVGEDGADTAVNSAEESAEVFISSEEAVWEPEGE